MSFLGHFLRRGTAFFPCRKIAGSGAALLAAVLSAQAQSSNIIRINASQPWTEPQPALYDGGAATSPSGNALGLNDRYLTRDGKPWLPVMGEFHFSRYPRAEWEDEILKMKAAGVDVIATYVIWIHHEEIEGQFDWEGQRDLRAFVELCAKHHMYVVARIGPWAHGEVRNGGFPDWVVKQGPTRVNDPVYLRSVGDWYGHVAQQLKGLLFKDGGPVIGIQVENEYSKRGPNAGEAHILELKKMARENGLDVPFYFVTGWDDAVVPPRAVLPLYGGYPAAPWDRSVAKLPPQEVYAFRFENRVAANKAAAPDPPGDPAADPLPFLTAEVGGGNEDTYHRRPVIAPQDIAAMVPVMLGSGVNLYGTYMFQGGENPDGKLSTLEESQATGYANDVPIKSYDFQAPLGEFGEERDSFRELKVFNYFLNDFGPDLAPMAVHTPEALPHDVGDLSAPRAAVRSRGGSGFIFFNNYVRGYSMPERRSAQFEIRLPGADGKSDSTLMVPRHPIDLPSGSFFIWPFNLHIGGATLRYSTAQLFTRMGDGGETVIYFEALPGIAPEFDFDAGSVREIEAPGAETVRAGSDICVTGIQPGLQAGLDRQLRVIPREGAPFRVVVLTADEAEHAWKVRIGAGERLLVTQQEIVPDSDAEDVRLLADGSPRFGFTLMPPVAAPATDSLRASLKLNETKRTAEMASYSAEAPERAVKLETTLLRSAGEASMVTIAPPVFGGKGVAEAPAAGTLPDAGSWAVSVPAGAMEGLSGLYLRIEYQGDVARLSGDGQLLDDNFYNGKSWTIGLKRFLKANGTGRFTLDILPLRKDAPVYLELQQPAGFGPNGQAAKLDNIQLIPEYELEIGAKAQ